MADGPDRWQRVLSPRPLLVDGWSVVEAVVTIVVVFALTQGPVYFLDLYVLRDTTIGVERPAVMTIYGILYAVVGLLLARHLVIRRRQGWRFTRALAVVAAAAAVFPSSALWSVDRGSTLVHGMATAGAVLVGVWLAVRYGVRTQLVLVAAAMSLGAAASALVIRVWPDTGIMSAAGGDGAWAGIYFNRNSLAPVAAVGLLALVGSFVAGLRLRWLPIALPLGVLCWRLLVGADSTAAFVGLAAAALAALVPPFVVGLRRARVPWWAASGPAVVAGCAAAWWVLRDLSALAERVAGATGLNNRGELWAYVRELIAERPVLGWGHYGVWNSPALVDRSMQAVGWAPPSAHNGLLELVLGLGVVIGTALAALVALGLGRLVRAVWRGDTPVRPAMAWFGLLAYVFVANTSESFVCANHILTAVLVACCLRGDGLALPPPDPGPRAGYEP